MCKSVKYFLSYSGFKSRPSFSMTLYIASTSTIFLSLQHTSPFYQYTSLNALWISSIEPCPRGSAQSGSPWGSGLCDIFRPFIHLFLAVVHRLAAVSGWTRLGAVIERFFVGQTLPTTSLALEPTKDLKLNFCFIAEKRWRPPQKNLLVELFQPLTEPGLENGRELGICSWLCISKFTLWVVLKVHTRHWCSKGKLLVVMFFFCVWFCILLCIVSAQVA